MANVGDINPETGVRYSPQEITRINSGLDPSTGLRRPKDEPASDVTSEAGAPTAQGVWFEGQYLGDVGSDFEGLDQAGQESWIQEHFGADVAGQVWSFGSAPAPEGSPHPPGGERPLPYRPVSDLTAEPIFGEGAEIPLPEVTPAPPFEKTPEQTAFEEMYSGQLTDWVEAGGYGIPEETQNLMIQKQTDTLKAREEESLRVMRNTMERRGLTNTGLIWANEQTIRSNTSVAIAGAISDVQIKSSLMKLASFENAMGHAGQFLNYLSTQSQLKYQPEFATWQAKQQAIMYQWQRQMDVLKLEINQAYQQQNIRLTAQLQMQLNQQQNAFEQQMLQMEIDATQQAAQAEGIGSIFGMILGIGASLIFGVPLFGF
ncbi:MAG: hypothetical protein KAW56_16745 [Candidatus Marinimicrobia bacterium]|nr:hypothetical protein [Candidatus Neomarinimicrobiota bacterium]